MKTLGRLFGILALIGMIIGFIPLFGWLNWIVIPFAILGLVISIVGKSKGGVTICFLAVILGILRLILGGGIL